jgi:hypothetical protein
LASLLPSRFLIIYPARPVRQRGCGGPVLFVDRKPWRCGEEKIKEPQIKHGSNTDKKYKKDEKDEKDKMNKRCVTQRRRARRGNEEWNAGQNQFYDSAQKAYDTKPPSRIAI